MEGKDILTNKFNGTRVRMTGFFSSSCLKCIEYAVFISSLIFDNKTKCKKVLIIIPDT